MTIDFQVTFTAKCDIEDAFNDFETIMEWSPDHDPDKAIYDAIEENLIVSRDAVEHLPQSVIEDFANALRKRIGGVQLEIELN